MRDKLIIILYFLILPVNSMAGFIEYDLYTQIHKDYLVVCSGYYEEVVRAEISLESKIEIFKTRHKNVYVRVDAYNPNAFLNFSLEGGYLFQPQQIGNWWLENLEEKVKACISFNDKKKQAN